jgi:hypothetical protein
MEGAGFFLVSWLSILLGWLIHVVLDKRPNRRTTPRVLELAFFWLLGGTGAWAIFGGFGHIGPTHDEIAEGIGYAPSKFQWEVGWSDIALGVLMLVAVWKRGQFIPAALIVVTIQYGGDAWGHIDEWLRNDNTEPNNVWAIPSDILGPLLLLTLYFVLKGGTSEPQPNRTDPASTSG